MLITSLINTVSHTDNTSLRKDSLIKLGLQLKQEDSVVVFNHINNNSPLIRIYGSFIANNEKLDECLSKGKRVSVIPMRGKFSTTESGSLVLLVRDVSYIINAMTSQFGIPSSIRIKSMEEELEPSVEILDVSAEGEIITDIEFDIVSELSKEYIGTDGSYSYMFYLWLFIKNHKEEEDNGSL